jgi:hypothetical protein
VEAELRFSLKRKSLVIVLEGESGEERVTMRDLSGAQRNKWLTSMGDRIKFGPNGKPQGFKTFDGLHSSLLTMCLSRDGVPIAREEIEEWPAEVQSKLFDKARELSGLDSEAAEDLGNG